MHLIRTSPNCDPNSHHCPITPNMFSVIFFLSLFLFVSAQDVSSCTAGTFFDSKKCRKCPQGTYQPFNASTSCIPCPPGTFNIFKGAQGVDLCEPCIPNTFNPTSGATSPSMCRKCPSGTGSVSGADRCMSCPLGSFLALRNGDAENYRRGYNFCSGFRNPRDPSCYAGAYPRSSVCRKCSSGFTDTPNALRCTFCPFGATPNSDRTGCEQGVCSKPGVACFPGKGEVPCKSFRVNNGSSLLCNACPPGFIGNSMTGGTHCVPCPPGTVRSKLRGACLPCRKTVVENGTICTTINPGGPCPDNFFRHADGHCARCEIWQRLNRDRMVCEECPVDQISNGGADDTCQPCPKYATRPPYKLQIFSARTRVTGDRCDCSSGTERVAPTSSECRLCKPGTTSSGSGMCFACPTGSFAEKAGLSECKPCRFNFVAPDRGQSKCDSCPRGMVPNPIRGCVSAATNCPAGLRRVVDANNVILACREPWLLFGRRQYSR